MLNGPPPGFRGWSLPISFQSTDSIEVHGQKVSRLSLCHTLEMEEEGRGTSGKLKLCQWSLPSTEKGAKCWFPEFHTEVSHEVKAILALPCLFHKPIQRQQSSCREICTTRAAIITVCHSVVYFCRFIHINVCKNLPEWCLAKTEWSPHNLVHQEYFLKPSSEKTEQGSCPSDPLYPSTAVLINLVILFCLALVQKQTCWMKGSFGIIYQCNSGNSGLNSSFVLLPSETTMSSYLIGIIWHMFP